MNLSDTYQKAIEQYKANNHEEALPLFNQIIESGSFDDKDTLNILSKCLFYKGNSLNNLNKPLEAIKSYDQLIDRFIHTDFPELQIAVANSLANKAATWGKLDKPEEAIKSYNQLLVHFINTDIPDLQITVAKCLVNNIATLNDLNKPEEAINNCDKFLKYLIDIKEINLQLIVAKCLFNKGLSWHIIANLEEEINTYNQLLARFNKYNDPDIQTLMASSLLNKGVALGRMYRFDEANNTFDQILKRFINPKAPDLQITVAKSLLNKGITQGKLKKLDEAIKSHNKLFRRIINSNIPELKIIVARCLFSLCVIYTEQGKNEKAFKSIAQIESLFHKTNDDKVKDIYISSLIFKTELLRKTNKIEQARTIKAYINKTFPDLSPERNERLNYIVSSHFLNIDELIYTLNESFNCDIFSSIEESSKRTNEFISGQSIINPELNLFINLRQWNSFTPTIPDTNDTVRGGGYYIQYNGQGIVIDPGFDFIRNFYDAGGKLCNIQHIIITHAHNDHTQDLETILSLLHQRNREYTNTNPDKETHSNTNISDNKLKKINLYISLGVERKYSGIISLKNSSEIHRITILNHSDIFNRQRIKLHGLKGVFLTVLSAYHDDVITSDYAVGLGFEFNLRNNKKQYIVFTGDTSLYPIKRNNDGAIVKSSNNEAICDIDDKKALYNLYPNKFNEPDILVAHIGSVKKEEFDTNKLKYTVDGKESETHYFYPNHLGIRGMTVLINELRPKTALLSEFGEELKDIRCLLADKIAEIVNSRDSKKPVKVLPGDLGFIYNIETANVYAHDTKQFEEVSKVSSIEVDFDSNEYKILNNYLPRNIQYTKRIHYVVDKNINNEIFKFTLQEFYKRIKDIKYPYSSAENDL